MKLMRRIWLVVCNESVVGVTRTRKQAFKACRLRDSLLELECEVVGPFVLQRGAK